MQVGRTTFNLQHTLKTTSRFGTCDVTLCKMVLPKDTIRNSSDFFVELKPTTDKLNTTITSNLSSYFVPFEKVWSYFDQFLTKGQNLVRNGALAVPSMVNETEKSVNFLPQFNLYKVFQYFLTALPYYDSKSYAFNAQSRLTDYFGNNGNNVAFDWSYLDAREGKYVPVETTTEIQTNLTFWWLPRLIGYGVHQNAQINCNIRDIGDMYYLAFHFADPSVVGLFNYLGSRMVSDWTNFKYVNLEYVKDGDVLKFALYGRNDFYSLPDSVDYQFTLNINPSSNDYGFLTILPFEAKNAYLNAHFSWLVALTALFNHPLLLGKGSLIDTFFPMFRYVNLNELRVDKYFEHMSNDPTPKYGWLPIVGPGVSSDNCRINALPFFAYQSIITDKMLLPHEVLSNNSGQNSDLNANQFDSVTYRNNMVPTMCYENNDLYLENIFEGSLTQHGKVVKTMTDPDSTRLNHAVMLNQLLTVLLSRGPLIDSDLYTHMWQKENHLVDNIISESGINIVNQQGLTLNVQKFLLAKRTAQAIRFGGKDQTAIEFLENHFGLSDIPDHCPRSITLSTDIQVITAEDVVNTGGAVDSAGDPLALGAKASVATNAKPNRGYFEFFANTFGIVLQLHHLSVANEYFDVKNLDFSKLTSTDETQCAKRDEFDMQFLPEFQDTGDDLLMSTDYNSTAVAEFIAYKDKNFWLKQSANIVRGDYADIYRRQIIAPTDPNENTVQLSLTYEFLQKTPFSFSRNFVDGGQNSDHVLINVKQNCYRKSSMTKLNSVGLEV